MNGNLVSLREASRRLGIANVSDLKAKYPGFPPPTITAGTIRLWDFEQIRNWYESRNLSTRKNGTPK